MVTARLKAVLGSTGRAHGENAPFRDPTSSDEPPVRIDTILVECISGQGLLGSLALEHRTTRALEHRRWFGTFIIESGGRVEGGGSGGGGRSGGSHEPEPDWVLVNGCVNFD
jgi:hypothetical protein